MDNIITLFDSDGGLIWSSMGCQLHWVGSNCTLVMPSAFFNPMEFGKTVTIQEQRSWWIGHVEFRDLVLMSYSRSIDSMGTSHCRLNFAPSSSLIERSKPITKFCNDFPVPITFTDGQLEAMDKAWES